MASGAEAAGQGRGRGKQGLVHGRQDRAHGGFDARSGIGGGKGVQPLGGTGEHGLGGGEQGAVGDEDGAAPGIGVGVYRPVDAAAQGFEIGAQPGGRIPEFGQRHLPFAAFQRVDAPEKPRRVGPECPGDVTAAVHEVRHVLHGFPSRGRLRIRDAGGYLLPPFGGHRRELHGGGEIQRLGSPELGGLRQRIEQGGADAAGLLECADLGVELVLRADERFQRREGGIGKRIGVEVRNGDAAQVRRRHVAGVGGLQHGGVDAEAAVEDFGSGDFGFDGVVQIPADAPQPAGTVKGGVQHLA